MCTANHEEVTVSGLSMVGRQLTGACATGPPVRAHEANGGSLHKISPLWDDGATETMNVCTLEQGHQLSSP